MMLQRTTSNFSIAWMQQQIITTIVLPFFLAVLIGQQQLEQEQQSPTEIVEFTKKDFQKLLTVSKSSSISSCNSSSTVLYW